MRGSGVQHQWDSLGPAQTSQMLYGIDGNFQLRQHDSSVANRFSVSIYEIGRHLGVCSRRDYDAVLSLRRNRNHRNTGSAFMPLHRINVDPGLFEISM